MSADIVVFVLSGFIVVVLGVNFFLFWHLSRSSKKLDDLLEKGKVKEFKDIFLCQKERNDHLERQINDILNKIKNLENNSLKTIQKTSVVRFNPFSETGGNQSFTLAMLDAENNGFVISSLFIKEGNNRIYTKEIKRGKSNYTLSKEEEQALNRAIKG